MRRIVGLIVFLAIVAVSAIQSVRIVFGRPSDPLTAAIAVATLLFSTLTLLYVVSEHRRRNREVVKFADFEDPIFRNVLRGMAKPGLVAGWLRVSREGLTQKEIDKIRYIDVSGKSVISLQGIEVFGSLEHLNCNYSKIERLFLTKSCHLVTLTCRGCKNLEEVYCEENRLSTLDVTECYELKVLSCHSNQLLSLDVSTLSSLSKLWCWDNYFSSLDVSKCNALEELFCWGNALTSISLPKGAYSSLKRVRCCHNYIDAKDANDIVKSVRGRTPTLRLARRTARPIAKASPQFEKIDAEELYPYAEGMYHQYINHYLCQVLGSDPCADFRKYCVERSRIGFSGGRSMRAGRRITPGVVDRDLQSIADEAALKIRKHRQWKIDYCWVPSKLRCIQPPGASLSRSLIPRAICCADNEKAESTPQRARLIGLHVKRDIETSMAASNRLLSQTLISFEDNFSLDFTDSPDLKFVICDNSRLGEIRLRKSAALVYLDLTSSALSSISLEGCEYLEWLDLKGCSELEELDVTRNPSLRYVDCRGTEVKELDISRCPSLRKALFTCKREDLNAKPLKIIANTNGEYYKRPKQKTENGVAQFEYRPKWRHRNKCPVIVLECPDYPVETWEKHVVFEDVVRDRERSRGLSQRVRAKAKKHVEDASKAAGC